MHVRSRAFGRWLDGSCVECPPQTVAGSDTPFIFSFHPEVARHPDIIDVSNTILARAKDILTRVQRYFLRWNKHKPVWVPDKVHYNSLSLSHVLVSLCPYTLITTWIVMEVCIQFVVEKRFKNT